MKITIIEWKPTLALCPGCYRVRSVRPGLKASIGKLVVEYHEKDRTECSGSGSTVVLMHELPSST